MEQLPEFSCCPNFINNSPGSLPALHSPTSDLVSMASMRRFSFEKQRTEAWLNVIPTKEGESTSVYISHPVPWIRDRNQISRNVKEI